MSAHTSSLALWPWVKVAEQHGLTLGRLSQCCGLSPGELRDPAARISQDHANRVAALACEHLGAGAAMAAAQTVEAGHFQLVEQAVRAAPTVADGLDLMTELFPLLHFGGRIQHGRTRNESLVRYADLPGTHMHPAYVELLFAVGLEAIRRETGQRLQALRVTFTHPCMGPSRLYGKLLGPDVRFGMRTNSLVLSVEVANLPLLRANADVLAQATRIAGDSLPSLSVPEPHPTTR
ncbi:MAG: AraC family transcriptional regulator ligand-binding domain-containing protein [Myxococcales bacterium]|nr:AraC family transcriptional regulator ligand-binding domain-containing protein [Myxococcales bacterium]